MAGTHHDPPPIDFNRHQAMTDPDDPLGTTFLEPVRDSGRRPARFDVTEALQADNNRFAIFCERHHLNELGTGGLIGPVVLDHDRDK